MDRKNWSHKQTSDGFCLHKMFQRQEMSRKICNFKEQVVNGNNYNRSLASLSTTQKQVK